MSETDPKGSVMLGSFKANTISCGACGRILSDETGKFVRPCNCNPSLLDELSTLRARVAEAERERDDWRAHALECGKALQSYTPGGSEYFSGELHGYFKTDIAACCRVIDEKTDRGARLFNLHAKARIEEREATARAEAAERRLLPDKLTEEQREKLAMAIGEWQFMPCSLESVDIFHAILTRIEGESHE